MLENPTNANSNESETEKDLRAEEKGVEKVHRQLEEGGDKEPSEDPDGKLGVSVEHHDP